MPSLLPDIKNRILIVDRHGDGWVSGSITVLRNKMKRVLPLFISLLVLALEATGQAAETKFTLLKGADGISLGKVNSMTQDRLGFMWFSDQTNRCIIRYDGVHMERFQYDSKKPDGLGSYYPECLFADPAGNIWIGFYDGGGLDKYDPLTNTFTHFRHDPNNPESLANGTVSAVRMDHLGNLWVGTNGGLDMLNPDKGTFTHYQYKSDDSTSLSNNEVRAIYEDRQGTLWIGTGNAFDQNQEDGGLNRFDRTTRTFTRYLHDERHPHTLLDNAVRSIFEDKAGNFWVGTGHNGLHRMNRETGSFERFTYDKRDPEKLSAPEPTNSFSPITFITEDPAGDLWIGTMSNGVNRYNPLTKKIKHYGMNADNTGTFTDNSGWWIHVSTDGLIWISTQEANLYKIDISNKTVPFVESVGYPSCIYFEPPATLWLGTAHGLVKNDLLNKTSRVLTHNPQNFQSISDNNITSILKDKRGLIWLGTAHGLSRFDPGTQTFSNYHRVPGDSSSLASDYVLSVFEDHDSVLWVASSGGLQQLDQKTSTFKRYRSDVYYGIYEDNSGTLWLTSDNNSGILRFDRATGSTKAYLPGLIVLAFHTDNTGTIWLGTVNGLYRYDRQADSFFSIEEENPTIKINAAIGAIITDEENNVWLATTSGITRLDRKTNHITWYGKENGVNPEWFHGGGAAKDDHGNLYFAASRGRGYFAFDPARLTGVAAIPPLCFTKLFMNGKVVDPGPDRVLRLSLNNTEEVQMDYNQNTFDLTFTAIDFRHSQQQNISYLLENYDAEWRLSNSENRASYFKVPPGHYTFRIKVAGDEKSNGTERSIRIHITPPWWMTRWAYGFYGLAFVGGVFVVDRIQRRRIREKERALAREKELEQAREIEKAYTKLKSTQSQLIQSEKMASLGELTAGIAHEIQNPLNFVNNFSEVNKELLAEMKDEISKGNFEEAKTIANNAIENQEKITHHGKRADAIVKGMLQHSRSSNSGKEPTNINALADEYLRLSFHGLRAKDKSFNAKLETHFDETIGPVNIIAQDMGRVILNLINNAFYAVAERSALARTSADNGYEPTVIVSTNKSGDRVLISVRDNGKGIPQKALDKIFQPFFTTKPTGQGTGLGLSISYDIVKAHGGELKVETKEGEGTEFVISLPA